MRLKRAAVIVLAVLITALAVMPAAAADTYYYAAINGTLFPCTYVYMPLQGSDQIWCPSQFLLSAGLGFKYDYMQEQNFYTIYTEDKSKRLSFDLEQNYAFDLKTPWETAWIMRKNGVFYLPLDFVAWYFDFTYSKIPTPYGTVIRLKSNTDTVSDEDVRNALDARLAQEQNSYNSVNSLLTSPSPSPSPATSPTTAPSVRPSPSPSPSVRPSPSPSPTPDIFVYLSFDVGVESELAPVMEVLDSFDVPATFFMTPEFIAGNHGDTRRVVGSGYALGIQNAGDMDSADAAAATLEQLDAANDELRISALTQTRIISLSADNKGKVSPDAVDRLSDAGYRYWEWNIDAKDRSTASKPETVAANLVKAVDKLGGMCHVRFSCGGVTADVLKKLLPQLNQMNVKYYAISEARPPNYKP